MLDKLSTMLIVILSLICVIIMGKWGYDYYINECELYNENIVEFTIEMIKGNKSLEDIDTLDANDSVKESLRTYYNDTFYADDDKILLYDDIDFWMKNREKIALMQEEYGETILDEGCSYFLGSISEDDLLLYTEEELKYFELKNIYIDLLKNQIDDRVKEEENELYIYLKDLNFDTIDKEIIIYKGLKFDIYRDELEKSILRYCKFSEKYNTVEFQNIIESKKGEQVILKNIFDSKWYINYNFSILKKIETISITHS